MTQTTPNQSTMTLIPSCCCCCYPNRTTTSSSVMKRLTTTLSSSQLPSKVQTYKSIHVLCILFVLLFQIGCSTVDARSTSVNPKSSPYPFHHHRWHHALSLSTDRAKINDDDLTRPATIPLSNNSWSSKNSHSPNRVTNDKKLLTPILRRIVRAAQTDGQQTNGTNDAVSTDAFSSRTLDMSSFL